MRPVIKQVAAVFLVLLGITAAWLTYAATTAGSRYGDDPRNPRSAVDLDGPRGQIVTMDGVVVARDGDDARAYPTGSAYTHLIGFAEGPTGHGLEVTRRHQMVSRDDGSLTSLLLRLAGTDLGPPDIRLTVDDATQRAAVEALRGHTGAVVALDPRTGAVLAYASSPSFDPNDAAARVDAGAAGVDRVASRMLPPGSTFKTVVAAAALAGGATPDTQYGTSSEYTPPGGRPIRNAGGGTCGSGSTITLLDAFVVSCNTVFAELAVDLGAAALVDAATAAGFGATVPWELGAATAEIPAASDLAADVPALAQSGIGERDVRASPLVMALIAAAVANDGVAMAPYAVESIVAPDGSTISTTPQAVFRRYFSVQAADALRSMMTAVVERGTGTAARLPDIDVAGKTGTAEGGGGPHAWFIGFAPAAEPRIAVAVVIESGGSGTSGGRTAAPIAARVMQTYLNQG